MEKGWIKLYRSITENWVYDDAEYLKIWITFLIDATHKPHKRLIGNSIEMLKPGQFVFGRKKYSQRLNIKEWKLQKATELFVQDEMIKAVKRTNKYTVYEIINYSLYQQQNQQQEMANSSVLKQDEQQQNQQQSNSKSTAEQQQSNTNKNVKNVKNDKEDIYILAEDERQFLETLNQVENYPLNRKKDLEMYKILGERYPQLNLAEAIEQWRMYKLDRPLKPNSNPRSQINTAFKKYIEWGKCIKKGGANDGKHRANNQGASEETLRLEKIAKEQGLIGADGTIEEPEQVDF